jgi:hypothetical protein
MTARTSTPKRARATNAAALLLVVAMPFTAHAQSADGSRDTLETPPPAAGEAAASDGAFLPFSPSARHANRKATGKLLSGYDASSSSALFKAEAEATIRGPVGLRAGVSYDGIGSKSRPFIGGFFDVLEQSKYGLNLSLLGRLESHGFNAVPGVAAGFALSRSFDGTLLLASAEYGHGLEGNEQNAAGSLAFMQRLSPHFRLGLDGKFQIDLERDGSEPLDEPDWRTTAGPMLVASVGNFSATLGGGVSALRYRLSDVTHVGPAAYAGIGAAF